MITITTTQLNNRGGWSGGIKKEGKRRVDGRFGGEAKEIRRGENKLALVIKSKKYAFVCFLLCYKII
jgi:hypothetical protein